jgi:hypothetical protein
MWLIGLGLVLNTLVIWTNGAMPVSAGASQAAGLEAPSAVDDDLKHERLGDETVVPWLGDVIPVPGLKEVLSIGDLVIAAGIGWLIYARTTSGRATAKAGATSG